MKTLHDERESQPQLRLPYTRIKRNGEHLTIALISVAGWLGVCFP